MFKLKAILLHLVPCVLCLSAGAWLGNRHAHRNRRRDFYIETHGQIQSRIRVVDLIHGKTPDQAIQDLEQPLDTFVLIFGSSFHRPNLTPEERSILWLIAQHRSAHPFKNLEHPDYDLRVQKALQELR